jgi:ATP-dependent protease Clp ATPase subunit
MVPQFMARFDNTVLLRDLSVEVLKEILLNSLDSPFIRSKKYFDVMKIDLEIEDVAAATIAELAEKNIRTGARALRTVFGKIINPIEFDPRSDEDLATSKDDRLKIVITGDRVRRVHGL